MYRFIFGIVMFGVLALYAQTDSSLADAVPEYHKLDVETLKGAKSDVCFNCHIHEMSADTDSMAWLQPQVRTMGTIENLDNRHGVPDPFSHACLICHDGSSASLAINAPISPCGIKSDRSFSAPGENHPVFMTYQNKKDLHNASEALQGEWSEATQVKDLLREGKVVCISCHTPHHNKDTGYLRVSRKGSALCMGCHKK